MKDPFLAAEAARSMDATSRLRVLQIGSALEPAMAERARAEQAGNPRYAWLGELHRRDTLRHIASSHLLLVTSHLEGGANVVAEAVAASTPVLSTRIEGTLGMLGPDYPGYFAVGDARGLARLLERCEADQGFYAELAAACAARRPAFQPAAERAAWRALLAELSDAASGG